MNDVQDRKGGEGLCEEGDTVPASEKEFRGTEKNIKCDVRETHTRARTHTHAHSGREDGGEGW